MNMPGGAGTDSQPGRKSSEFRRTGGLERYFCTVGGFFLAAALVVLLYPLVLAVTRPFGLLSSTALVFVLVSTWFVTWISLEVAWEWRAGRLNLSSNN